MYKVFIDNIEVRFVEEFKKSQKKRNLFLELTDFKSNSDFFRMLLDYKEGDVVFVNCLDVVSDFKRVFRGYSKIAAAGGVVQRKKSILVIERLGKWDLPKGKIEKGEIPQVAAYREIEEECGIEGHVLLGDICETYHTYTFKNRKVLKRNYWYYFHYDGPKTLTAQLEEDITDAKWVKKTELKKIKGNTYASIKSVLKKWEKKFG